MKPCKHCVYSLLCYVYGFEGTINKIIFQVAGRESRKGMPREESQKRAEEVVNEILGRRPDDCPVEVR